MDNLQLGRNHTGGRQLNLQPPIGRAKLTLTTLHAGSCPTIPCGDEKRQGKPAGTSFFYGHLIIGSTTCKRIPASPPPSQPPPAATRLLPDPTEAAGRVVAELATGRRGALSPRPNHSLQGLWACLPCGKHLSIEQDK